MKKSKQVSKNKEKNSEVKSTKSKFKIGERIDFKTFSGVRLSGKIKKLSNKIVVETKDAYHYIDSVVVL